MKFFHLSDLHLGLRLYEVSMLEDQQYILNQIYELAKSERPDGILIAGDIYDKTVPPTGAITLFDGFLTRLCDEGIPVYIIAGNHDSVERLSFGADMMRTDGIYIAPPYNGRVEPIVLSDAYGEVHLYLLPYIRPSDVRNAHEHSEVSTFSDAVAFATAQMKPDPNVRNVILTHQFLLGASAVGSEEAVTVGGTDAVSTDAYAAFDYVAAGHIHSAQSVTRPTVRYSGTPLAYSFSELSDNKSVSVVTLWEKGSVTLSTIPLVPRRPLIRLEGSFESMISPTLREGLRTDAYFEIHLTDGELILDAAKILHSYYPNLLHVTNVLRDQGQEELFSSAEDKTPMEYVEELYLMQNGCELDACEREYLCDLTKRVWEEKK